MKDLIEKYDRFLDSKCPWTHYVCGSCNFWATHPLSYCPKCPGNIYQIQYTWLQHLRMQLNKSNIIHHNFYQAAIQVDYPSEEYYMLHKHLQSRLNEKT